MTEEICTFGLLKRYCKRPPKLENLTPADWAAWYDNCSSKPYVKETHEIDIDGLPLEKYIDDEQNDDDDEFVKTTNGKTRRRSKARVLRSVWSIEQKEPEKHYRELLMLFTPWRNEETELPFGAVSIVAIGDLFQLQPAMDGYIFKNMNNDEYGILAPNVWQELFKTKQLHSILHLEKELRYL